MDGHDPQNKVIQRLLNGSATASESAEALATSETVVLSVLDRLRGDEWNLWRVTGRSPKS
jgi:hypothetical protein